MDVCGIDPGLETSGYAVVRFAAGRPSILDAGVCRSDLNAPLHERLAQIDHDFDSLFEQWPVDLVAVEQLYAHYKHPRTAVKMGHGRGVILCVAGRRGLSVQSFAATAIKKLLTGNGRASKVQVQRAVSIVYGLSSVPEPNDVADALAIAYAAAHGARTQPTEVMQG